MIPLGAIWAMVKPFRGWIAVGIGAALVLAGLHAWGNARYRQGRDDNEAAWKAAEKALHKREVAAADGASSAALVREVDHARQVANEKAKLDDAIREGASPLDVLFGGPVGVCSGQGGGCQSSGSR